MVFKKPGGSRTIYRGMAAIPLSYAATIALISNPLPLPVEQTALRVLSLILISGIATVPAAMVLYILSFILYLITGIDTCSLSDSTRFGYLIESKDQLSAGVLETLVGRSDFFVWPAQQDDGTGYISAGKGPLRLGLYYSILNQVIDSTFILYEVNNEVVSGPTRQDEVLDFQAEISGLLEGWKSRGKIEEYSFTQGSEIQRALHRVEDELGPRKIVRIPSGKDVKGWLESYPKAHAAWYSLWLAIVSAFIGWLLSRFLK
jgi:hypothetical protein